ncbi:MAG: hypothetical protein RSD75_07175 [Mucinivorans sp.]
MRSLLLVIASLFIYLSSLGQPLRVGFYNVENLFDTINQPSVDDGDFTPTGRKKWTAHKYESKITNLVRSISLFDPDVLGVCEVENYGVVCDLAQRTARLTGVVHYDSHDSRGIDVALLFDTTKLHLVASEPIFVGTMRRSFLRVDFLIAGSKRKDKLTVFVVHLPSKLGGSKASIRRGVALHALDSLTHGVEYGVVVGDMNDSPREVGALYNCAIEPFEHGRGSYAYRDVWDMIDQIFITRSLLPYCDGVQQVMRHPSLIVRRGRWSGYPRKGAVSDHLPVYLDLDIGRAATRSL